MTIFFVISKKISLYDKLSCMKIIIATPLFPPDTNEVALYMKELSVWLAKKHAVTIVMYGSLPERVNGVTFVTINKHLLLPVRLFLYTIKLWSVVRGADIIYAQNGASVELPVSLVSLLTNTPLILNEGDVLARAQAKKSKMLKLIETFVSRRAKTIIRENPKQRPEILPFEPQPLAEITEYKKTWETHLALLEDTFKKYV